MKTTLKNPNTVALVAFLLVLPFSGLITLLILGIEPPLGPLKSWMESVDSRVGSLVVLGALLLFLVGGWVNLAPLRRARRVGESLGAYPLNLALAILVLAVLLLFTGAIIVDQYPCWVGVPNCD